MSGAPLSKDGSPSDRHPLPALISIKDLKTHCSTCTLRELCMPIGLGDDDLQQLDALVGPRTRLRRGDTLYRAGDPFSGLYAVRVGSFKTTLLAEDGREQVGGYFMTGDLMGLDGFSTERHGTRAVALEDAEVCVLPFGRLEALCRDLPALQRNLQRFLAREIGREHTVLLMLGSMRAEERLAAFLLDVGRRFQQRGYSPTQFVLRMTREEIGSYLGLKLETVSRMFSRFHEEGLIRVRGRDVTLLDLPALRQLCGQRD